MELKWIEIDVIGHRLFLYDQAMSAVYTYHRIARLEGTFKVMPSPVVSTRGGFVLVKDHYRTPSYGKGFTVEVGLKGNTFIWQAKCPIKAIN